jgi:hypothetical protein
MKSNDIVYLAVVARGSLEFLGKGKILPPFSMVNDTATVRIRKIFYASGSYINNIRVRDQRTFGKHFIYLAQSDEQRGVIRSIFGWSFV